LKTYIFWPVNHQERRRQNSYPQYQNTQGYPRGPDTPVGDGQRGYLHGYDTADRTGQVDYADGSAALPDEPT
jgi:hypothetical protein